MRAEDARNLTNNTIAVNYIMQAASTGKLQVNIPKDFVDIGYLESQGYRIIGGFNQLSEEYVVSWEKHGRDY